MVLQPDQLNLLDAEISRAQVIQAQSNGVGLGFAEIGDRPQVPQAGNLVLDHVVVRFNPEELRADEIREFIVDARLVERLAFMLVSSLDEQADMQVFGAFRIDPGPGAQFDIGSSVALPVNEARALSVDLRAAWYPYVGVRVAPVLPVSSGALNVEAHMQKWFPPAKG